MTEWNEPSHFLSSPTRVCSSVPPTRYLAILSFHVFPQQGVDKPVSNNPRVGGRRIISFRRQLLLLPFLFLSFSFQGEKHQRCVRKMNKILAFFFPPSGPPLNVSACPHYCSTTSTEKDNTRRRGTFYFFLLFFFKLSPHLFLSLLYRYTVYIYVFFLLSRTMAWNTITNVVGEDATDEEEALFLSSDR